MGSRGIQAPQGQTVEDINNQSVYRGLGNEEWSADNEEGGKEWDRKGGGKTGKGRRAERIIPIWAVIFSHHKSGWVNKYNCLCSVTSTQECSLGNKVPKTPWNLRRELMQIKMVKKRKNMGLSVSTYPRIMCFTNMQTFKVRSRYEACKLRLLSAYKFSFHCVTPHEVNSQQCWPCCTEREGKNKQDNGGTCLLLCQEQETSLSVDTDRTLALYSTVSTTSEITMRMQYKSWAQST